MPQWCCWCQAVAIGKPTDLSALFGYVLAPLAWVIGTPWVDATTLGGLIGEKIVLNEFVAYAHLADIVNGKIAGVSMTDEGRLIATYALCGFANFSSIAIQMAVTGGLAPNQRPMIAKLGIKALAAGSLSNLMSAALAGMFLAL